MQESYGGTRNGNGFGDDCGHVPRTKSRGQGRGSESRKKRITYWKITPPMVLASWKVAAYRENSTFRKFAEMIADMDGASGPVTEEDFKPQCVKINGRYASGQTWQVDVDK